MKEIYVKFLGIFEIRTDDEVVIRIKSTKNRVKKLLGLLMLPEMPRYTDEELVDKIWQDESVSNQETALTKLVYLARKILRDIDGELEFIIRDDGKYIWNPEIEFQSDVSELYQISKTIEEENLSDDEILENALKGIALFDGEIAANFEYSIWSLAINEYYINIFIDITLKACSLLSEINDKPSWETVIEISVKAAKYASDAEPLHLYMFQGLKALKRRRSIVDYYNRMREYYKKNPEKSINNEIKKIYNWAERSQELTFSDIEQLAGSLMESSESAEIKGAYYCEMDIFKNMAHFILRNSMRNDHDIVVMLLNIAEYEDLDLYEREKEMDILEDVILKSLRSDDVVSRYSINQFIIMPFECDPRSINIIERRLNVNFEKLKTKESLSLEIVNFKMGKNGYELIY